ncbi:MAG TPA: molybdenum cofactor biosynthesis protein MoaE [Thermoanaerobaculia bacterium]|nr:molybdenum cofactor biosynthesis protein MoaE [Thermoanaerobaculia bacterium]
MKVRVLAFATAAEAVGAGEREVELVDGATLADLRRALDAAYPALVQLWPRLAVAVDGRLAPAADAPLAEGAEVALLPPVSGGSGARPEKSGLVEGTLDVAAVTAAVSGSGCGAVVTFLGTVRDQHQGRPVDRLVYSAYRTMAERALAGIVADLEAEHAGLSAAIVHRVGEVPVGEASVVIATASPHRAAAYEASRTALERLKREVPIWKREHYADGGAAWREEEPLTPSPPVSAPS